MNRRKLITYFSKLGRKNRLIARLNRLFGNLEIQFMRLYNDETFAKRMYRRYTGKELNLKEPITFNDKIWWLKFNNVDPLISQCSDKFTVRSYVKDNGLESILTKLYGVFVDAQAIDFDSFHNEVFIKCTHGAGGNIIFKPGMVFDRRSFIRDFNSRLRHNAYFNSREWGYLNSKPKIICEEVLRNADGSLPEDYKFLCFDGEPRLVIHSFGIAGPDGKPSVSGERYSNVYDMSFAYVPLITSYPTRIDRIREKPLAFEKMIDIAKTLSSPFPHCRVDLYNLEGKIYFGELTFYHSGGCGNIEPEEWSKKMGDWIDLESPKIVRK